MELLDETSTAVEEEHAVWLSPELPCRPIRCPEESNVPVNPESAPDSQSMLLYSNPFECLRPATGREDVSLGTHGGA